MIRLPINFKKLFPDKSRGIVIDKHIENISYVYGVDINGYDDNQIEVHDQVMRDAIEQVETDIELNQDLMINQWFYEPPRQPNHQPATPAQPGVNYTVNTWSTGTSDTLDWSFAPNSSAQQTMTVDNNLYKWYPITV